MLDRQGRIRLLEIAESDLPQLLLWRNDAKFAEMCTFRPGLLCMDGFRAELIGDFEHDRLCQYVIELAHRQVPIGTIYAYGLNRVDGYCFITTYIADEYTNRGYGIDATALLVEHLFAEFDLFKVYMDVYQYNEGSISALRHFGCTEEGHFKKQRLLAGTRHDVLRFAFFSGELNHVRTYLKRRRYNYELAGTLNQSDVNSPESEVIHV